MTNKFLYLIFACCIWLLSCKDINNSNKVLPASVEEYTWKMVWNDEFDQDGLPDTKKWAYHEGDGCPHVCGWGNNELQYYKEGDKDNARVEDGNLIIEAHKVEGQKYKYSSAKLVTQGKQTWKYGKLEIRANLPTGRGTWPAIWMMPAGNRYGGWPRSGEIDIMEHVGYDPDTIIGTVHTEAFNHIKGTQVAKYTYLGDSETAFHTYSITWDEESIKWFIDGNEYHSFENKHITYEEWPFDKPFYLILNLAVGGNWGGEFGVDQSIWPQQMQVDYVRVYKMNQLVNIALKNKE
ncbi:MAG: beta-glucanase (GH16 family) [Saprospiraceae bacterium]|jgi:beta-glucanase (GH16 family)